MEEEKYEKYNIWQFFSKEHDLTLLDGELEDIIREVEKYLKDS